MKILFMPLMGSTARGQLSGHHSPILESDRPGFLSCSARDSLQELDHGRKVPTHNGI